MIVVSDVNANDISGVRGADFLFSYYLSCSLVLKRSLQEDHFAVPKRRGDPVVSLFLEKGQH